MKYIEVNCQHINIHEQNDQIVISFTAQVKANLFERQKQKVELLNHHLLTNKNALYAQLFKSKVVEPPPQEQPPKQEENNQQNNQQKKQTDRNRSIFSQGNEERKPQQGLNPFTSRNQSGSQSRPQYRKQQIKQTRPSFRNQNIFGSRSNQVGSSRQSIFSSNNFSGSRDRGGGSSSMYSSGSRNAMFGQARNDAPPSLFSNMDNSESRPVSRTGRSSRDKKTRIV